MKTTNRRENESGDVLDYRNVLRETLAAPELDEFDRSVSVSDRARCAAYAVVRAFGYCRLFGIDPGEDLDVVLSPQAATAAGQELVRLLKRGEDDAHVLADRWDHATAPLEMETPCSDLLELEMDAWAAVIAIEEAYANCLEEGTSGRKALEESLGDLLEELRTFDAAVKTEAELLSTVTDTHLLQNWRSLLATEFAESLPWWLDGSLEAIAERVRDTSRALMPDEAWWRATRDACLASAKRGASAASEADFRHRLRPVWTPASLVAATSEQVGADWYWWDSPDGVFEAELCVPVPPDQGESQVLHLEFYRRKDRQKATELAGATVRLVVDEAVRCREEWTIDAQGAVHLTLADLRAAIGTRDIPALVVGEPPTVWDRREST